MKKRTWTLKLVLVSMPIIDIMQLILALMTNRIDFYICFVLNTATYIMLIPSILSEIKARKLDAKVDL